ncbi:HYC_CC_PP family protein [Chitinophaga alhagiae]|uniref:HYC_CC_PP family protein n=1 Tax=Chitinophaga alhagiae TaxID=2203219 RepID=UPI000E5BC2EA|nr:hypothetical protein [Chitinophaga alhagiae]
MKKFLALVLLTLYMGSSTGATFRLHYCKGRLVAVQLAADKTDQCGQCGAINQQDCCKSEHKTVKLEKDQQPTAYAGYAMPVAMALPVTFPPLMEPDTARILAGAPPAHAPPPAPKVHPNVLHCSFRI